MPENVMVSVANDNDTHDISCANFMAAKVTIQPSDSEPTSDIFETPNFYNEKYALPWGIFCVSYSPKEIICS